MHALRDGGERADVGADDPGVRTDDRGTDDARALHDRAGRDAYPAEDLGVGVDLAVDPVFEVLQHGAVGLQHVVDVAGVLPIPGDGRRTDVQPLVQQPLDGVGDLQFAAGGGGDRPDRPVDRGTEEVGAHQGQVALGPPRLLLQADDAPVGAELGDPEAGRVRHFGEQQPGVARVRPESGHGAGDPADDEVVAEEEQEVVVLQEVPCDEDAVRQAERGLLPDVGDPEAELRAVADGVPNLRGGVTDDDADLGYPRVGDGLQAVEQDRLVPDRHELFGGRVRDGAQPSSRPTREDQGFHGAHLWVRPRGGTPCPLLANP